MMIDMNDVISNNICKMLRERNISVKQFAEDNHMTLKEAREMLVGLNMVNAIKLKEIAAYLNTTTLTLSEIPKDFQENNVVSQFKNRVSESGMNAVEAADQLSDMIIFHSKVRENGDK